MPPWIMQPINLDFNQPVNLVEYRPNCYTHPRDVHSHYPILPRYNSKPITITQSFALSPVAVNTPRKVDNSDVYFQTITIWDFFHEVSGSG